MLPILITESNEAIGESLDIVNYINRTHGSSVLTVPDNPAIETWMEDAMTMIYSLAIPRWAISDFAEFHRETARKYFINKKEAVFGPFPRLLEQTATMVSEINAKLEVLERLLAQQERDPGHYSLTDIRLFPLLRALSIVKGITWPQGIDTWRKEMAVRSLINLNEAIAI